MTGFWVLAAPNAQGGSSLVGTLTHENGSNEVRSHESWAHAHAAMMDELRRGAPDAHSYFIVQAFMDTDGKTFQLNKDGTLGDQFDYDREGGFADAEGNACDYL